MSAALVLAGLLLVGCTSDPSACEGVVQGGGDTPLPAAIDDIIERRCRMCHTDPTQNFAPMPLVSWEDLHAQRSDNDERPVYEVVESRIHNEDFPMPPLPAPSLSDEEAAAWPRLTDGELATLDDWIADCAPAAD